MNVIIRNIMYILLFCGLTDTQAQTGFYVPQSARIFFAGDTATIFSNVLNAGKLGIGKNAVVNFKGKHWENEAGSMITDTSNGGDGVNGSGGLLRFMGDLELQSLFAAYNAASRAGPAFANFELNNPYGLQLTGSSAKILHELKLSQGLFYLNTNILSLGNNNPGVISGYNENRYLVTSNSPGNGLLIRENISVADGLTVFPIGSKPNAYTPGAIHSQSLTGDDYYMGVFDSVKANVTSGTNLRDSSVNKTWEVGKINGPGVDDALVYFQHLVGDEGSYFASNRNSTYVSRYNGIRWDSTAQMQPPAIGFLTSGAPLANSGVNNRQGTGMIGSSTFFTKFTGINKPLPVETKAWLNAYRTDWRQVKVYWTTKPEIDQDYFVVQRRLSSETGFRNIDTVKSKAPNGTSINPLNYSIMDENPHTGISYYRLLLVNLRNEQAYSNMVAVKGKPGGYQLLLWPNPSTGRFYVGISGAVFVKSVMVYDLLGRRIREEKVGERTIIEMNLYIPGTYMITFVGAGGELIETKKLVVHPYK